jgi:hypothetical protein
MRLTWIFTLQMRGYAVALDHGLHAAGDHTV